MPGYSLIAPAKINLHLEIIGDRVDGFHELVMVLQSISLADRVEIVANNAPTIRLYCNHPQMPLPEQNLAYKAAQLMTQQFPQVFASQGGVDITLDKRIPVAAGLAGGSANGAAVLVGLNLLWNLGLTQPELQVLAAQLGSDIPFCIAGGTAIATGRGEKLDSIASSRNLWVILAKYQSLEVSTAWAYTTYRQKFGDTYLRDDQSIQARTSYVHSSPLVEAIAHQDGSKIGQLLHNDLEKVVLPEYPQVSELKAAFERPEVLGTMMSGSGPTVFALCATQAEAEKVAAAVKQAIDNPDLGMWIAQFTTHGIQVEP
ncbi:MAG: 4-(cytidine 5'-diphospho)-2-C-methyl-D-erythritol kinase [Jaaginema sp. PMC 1079.18]|nr:4-(cytidine 5'-diphospho)-2-C-methyl-D-erythritol kinase [Jaaginema sp. PMC 1080.18]MEC4852161.1 4-(cytidine 5'-diphospho)-2-C-methyl-D-erythritol kinase [Jaaginema sp. PMC 1079.18]MEC4864848.1 4-(cytidine 5'-diphospho)-2-C-methyl-D-erythritol kinase [Jaaginema sp. PMC 1078.18]